MAIHPLSRLLLDVETLAVRFETLRLELLDIVWQLRQHANAAAAVSQPATRKRKTLSADAARRKFSKTRR